MKRVPNPKNAAKWLYGPEFRCEIANKNLPKTNMKLKILIAGLLVAAASLGGNAMAYETYNYDAYITENGNIIGGVEQLSPTNDTVIVDNMLAVFENGQQLSISAAPGEIPLTISSHLVLNIDVVGGSFDQLYETGSTLFLADPRYAAADLYNVLDNGAIQIDFYNREFKHLGPNFGNEDSEVGYQYTVVPEPATVALLGMGGVAALIARRRRQA